MILVIDCGSSKSPYIAKCIDEFMDVKTIPFEELSAVDLSTYLGVVISGAPILLTDIDPASYLDKISWIKSYEKPILGICFGHQLLGLTYGAAVSLH